MKENFIFLVCVLCGFCGREEGKGEFCYFSNFVCLFFSVGFGERVKQEEEEDYSNADIWYFVGVKTTHKEGRENKKKFPPHNIFIHIVQTEKYLSSCSGVLDPKRSSSTHKKKKEKRNEEERRRKKNMKKAHFSRWIINIKFRRVDVDCVRWNWNNKSE